jgi:hypothetical protein
VARPTVDQEGDAFIREVEEDLRQDRLTHVWKAYGRWLLAGLVLMLAGLAAYLWWQGHRQELIEKDSARFQLALEQLSVGKPEASKELEALIASGAGGYPELAGLVLGADLASRGEAAKAVAAYQAVAKSSSDPAIKDLAELRTILVQFDTLKPADAIARLAPLAVEGKPWYPVAAELLAIAHLEAGQPQQARPLLESLAENEAVVPSIRERTRMLADSLPAAPAPEPAAKTTGEAK